MKLNDASKHFAFCICAIALTAVPAYAASKVFVNTTDGSWETAGNWSPATSPGSTDNIFITNNGTYAAIVNNTTADTDPGGALSWLTISSLSLGSTNGLTSLVIDFTNALKTLSVGTLLTESTVVGNAVNQRGTLTISNGSFSTGLMQLGNLAGARGTLNIAGGTTTIRGPGGLSLAVGSINSTGTVVMTGGRLVVTNHIGTGTFVGGLGRGSFTLADGLFVTRNLNIGNRFVTSEVNILGGTSLVFAASGGDALRMGTFADGKGQLLINGGTLIVTNGISRVGIAGAATIIQSNGLFVAESVFVGINTAAAARGEWRILGSGSTSVVRGPLWIGGPVVAATGTVAVVGSPTLDWRSNINVQAGGRLSFGNFSGSIGTGGTITNLGRMDVVNSTVTYSKPFVLDGAYVSDPSTNTFAANLTVTPSGYLQGGAGDLFDFKQNLIINSTNSSLFDLASSTVSFSGSNGSHTNAVAGEDFGPGLSPGDKPFSYYNLKLETASDEIFFTSGVSVATSNALYVWQLELPNSDTNYVANLHSPFNIYYVTSNAAPQNAYLNDMTYALAGGGFLLPAIPEPSTLGLLALAGLALIRSRYRS